MARRGKKTSAKRAASSSRPCSPRQEQQARSPPEAGVSYPDAIKRFERPLPKDANGLTSSGDVILAREIKPQEANYPQYLRERAVSALIELERMAFKNFQDAIALATAAVQATDTLLNLSAQETACPSRPSPAAPPVVEELSSSSSGSGDFEGFLNELLRLLSLDLTRYSREPQPQKQQQQQQLQQQQQALQRLDLLQRLASTEPKGIKEALLKKDTDTSGALHLSILERLSSGESSEALHLSLLEKLSFFDDPSPSVQGASSKAGHPARDNLTRQGDSKAKGSPALSLRQQLIKQEESGSNLHLSLLERIGSLADIPAGSGDQSSEALHLSVLFGRGLSQETIFPGSSPSKDTQHQTSGKHPVTSDAPQTPCKQRIPSGGPQSDAVRGGAAARQQFTLKAPESPGSSSSCSGSSESCGKVPLATCGFRDTEADFPTASQASVKPRRGRGYPKCAAEKSPGALQGTETQQQQQMLQRPRATSNNTSALRSVSPMPCGGRPNALAPIGAPTGPATPLGGEGSASQSLSTAAATERRPASAVPQNVMSPQVFWDLFYARTTHKMLADSNSGAQTVVAASPRPATFPPGILRRPQEAPQEGERQNGALVWLDSQSSLDTPCPGGCGSRCEERPLDAESSGISSRDSLQLGGSAIPLALKGVPIQQQQQQERQSRVSVAGPVEANGRPPLLLEGPIPMLPATACYQQASQGSQGSSVSFQRQQEQQSSQPAQAQHWSPRRKSRGGKRRSSAYHRR